MFTSSVEEHLKNYNTIKTIESQLYKYIQNVMNMQSRGSLLDRL